MDLNSDSPTRPSMGARSVSGLTWFRELNRYQTYVFVIAVLGWLFDTMDQRIFLVSRQNAMTELLGYERNENNRIVRAQKTPLTSDEDVKQAEARVKQYAGFATAVFMLGWATGGMFFGIMGDRWGRARTMLITILIYSLFTGLSALSRTPWDFMFYRFLTGLGVGGEFAAGIALVAEVMPSHVRPFALGLLQALSAVGNIMGSLLSQVLLPYGWQYMFLVGTIPALLVVAVRSTLKEPDTWRSAADSASLEVSRRLGSLSDLFSDPRWRTNTIVGFLLALSGVVGLWGVGFWSFELVSDALQGKSSADVNRARAYGTALQDVGAFLGIYLFSVLSASIGRRATFAMGYIMALAGATFVFSSMKTEADVYWMLPLLGFSTMMLFGGFAVYFPELFPTRLRSTGTGFCYNAARFIAALGPFTLGQLVKMYSESTPTLLSRWGGVDSPLRYAAITVAVIYLLGLLVIPFAPETKDRPLPE